ALSKLVRIAGGDQLHTGTAAGKMHGSITEVQSINRSLIRDWAHLKPVIPVASGAVHPGNLPSNILFLGPELTINLGGGIHGHPDGTRAGAKAARQAIDAIIQGKTLEEAARESEVLRKALEKWSYVPIPDDLKSHVTWWPSKN
ncbi:MAG: RuBisCO large subunit C-terminal-like domain-containing protein, partial [Candidatus Bathyarchaeia archaeon]